MAQTSTEPDHNQTKPRLWSWHTALPIFEVFTDTEIDLGAYDLRRIEEVHQLVTKVMLGAELTSDQLQPQYFLFSDGYYRERAKQLEIVSDNPEMFFGNRAVEMIASSLKTVFVGDSITDGCKNGGYGWFEPLLAAFEMDNFLIEAHGGATIKSLRDHEQQIAAHQADLYIIAVGTNDIRYRHPKFSAMTAEEYISEIKLLVSSIIEQNPAARFIFVAPWPSLENDPFNRTPPEIKQRLFFDYSEALKRYCGENGFLFANPAAAIIKEIDLKPINYYLKDHIHPNASHGIQLYSKAFLNSF